MNTRFVLRRFLIAVAFLLAAGGATAHAFDQAIPTVCPIPRSTDIGSVTITDLHRTYDGSPR